MARRPKFFFKQELKNIPKGKLKEYLHTEVFTSEPFKLHVKQVAFNLEIDEVIVKDVLISYFTNVCLIINTARKVRTKINIYGFFSLIVEKGHRV